MKYLQLAFSFLTIIPVKIKEDVRIEDLSLAAVWFPFVGAVIGGVVVLARWGASFFVSPFAASVLAVTAWVLLSGGLHLDGLADCCDGMLAAATPSRRLEIMKDPRLGTFGGAGLVLHLLFKIALLATLSNELLVIAIVLATTLGRWMVLLGASQPQARSNGLGVAFASDLRWFTYLTAFLLPLAIACLAGPRGIVGVLVVHLTGLVVFGISRHRLGGITGDVHGLLIELSEVVVLLVFAAQWPLVN
jgi:adenosylcobinamide-GDP ribazoletransferase